jgi:RNA polymerase sigma-70 factor, ECF subfamily
MAATIGPNGQSDDDLLRRARTGDAAAFTTVYRRYQGPVFRFAMHMSGSRPVAEDVTQEIFMTLIENRCSFDSSRGTLMAYLLGVTRNVTLRRLEKERTFVSLPEEEASPKALPRTNGHSRGNLTVLPPDPVRAETIGRVRDAVLSLPPHYREIVVLCDLQEMSYEEAAKIMDCAVGTVRSRLHRARALLMEKLRDVCGAEDRLKMMRIV